MTRADSAILKSWMQNSNSEMSFPPDAGEDDPGGLARSSLNHVVHARRKNHRQLEAGLGEQV
jgi:hypothetical protein